MRTILPMWDEGLRAKMMFMTSLLSQPFTTAQSDVVVKASLLRHLRGRFAR
jgi:hypothetical protein